MFPQQRIKYSAISYGIYTQENPPVFQNGIYTLRIAVSFGERYLYPVNSRAAKKRSQKVSEANTPPQILNPLNEKLI